MNSDETVEKLIAQCKSSDVDVKVDALTNLEPLFDNITESTDIDGIIAVLKSCLRTPNHHLATAALHVLPAFFRRLAHSPNTVTDSAASSLSPVPGGRSNASIHQLRQALLAFLPSGGVLDRLGDQREKARDAARDAFVTIASVAYSFSPSSVPKGKDKAHEPPLAIVEKHVKELGLASKSFRVREQTILALVAIRRGNPAFPIRPYLPQLVDCLEDSDGAVRDCARASIVALFSGPQVTDAARADLKNEMTKKRVRKAIVSDLLGKLLSGSAFSTAPSSTSEATDPPTEDENPFGSTAFPRKPAAIGRSATAPLLGGSALSADQMEEVAPEQSTEIAGVYIASGRDLDNEFSRMTPCFEGKETEHNWLDREKSIIRIRGMVRGGVYNRYPDAFFLGLKGGILEKTLKGLQSLRTTLASHACFLYGELAAAMLTAFDPLVETVLTHLLKTGGITKKLVAQQSQNAVTEILTHTSAQPRLVLPLLWSCAQEKTIQLRNYAMRHVRTMLEVHATRPAGKAAIESSGGVDYLEKVVQKGLGDANAAAREEARRVYWLLEEIWPSQAAKVMISLDDPAKKQLAKANPRPGGMVTTVAATPAAKKSSVAAAIAASRAKAKILATAPPTLRHAATSGASAAASASAKSSSPPPARREAITVSTLSRRAASPASAGPARRSTVGLASPPSSRSSSPPVARPTQSHMSTSTSGKDLKVSIAINPPPQRPRAYSPSPPVSPTPLGASSKARRTSSPLSSLATSASRIRPALSATTPSSTIRAHTTPSRIPHVSRSSLSSMSDHSQGLELLTAVRIPLPPDSDDDGDANESLNLMSFSSAWEKFEGGGGSGSQSSSHAPGVPDSVILDSYRAQAQQAESAAAQLLELVNEDDLIGLAAPPLLPAFSRSTRSSHSPPRKQLDSTASEPLLVTPKNKSKLFEDSPAVKPLPMLAKVLFEQNDKTGDWWRLRTKVLNETGISLPEGDESQRIQSIISELSMGTADVETLKSLLCLCHRHPCRNAPPSPELKATRSTRNGMLTPTTPSPMSGVKQVSGDPEEFWEEGRLFDSLLTALFMGLSSVEVETTMDHGLITLYEMVMHQSAYLTGNESTIFAFLMEVRYSKQLNAYEGTNAIRDALVEKCDPVIGLTIVHQDLDAFLKRSTKDDSITDAARTSSYSFCLVAMAKFILLLPAEVLEDELPRVQGSLLKALAEKSSAVIREAAYVTIIAAQIKLQDETHLFALLGGLSETQKHLLTYEFEKMKTRGHLTGGQLPEVGLQKLADKMRHLDALPSRPVD